MRIMPFPQVFIVIFGTILTIVPAAAGTEIVQLRYSEPAVKKPKCVGTGLTGKMVCVQKDSVPGGGLTGKEDPNPIASAELTVVLRAYLEILDDETFIARIKVERSNLVIIGNMAPQTQNDVQSDARLVKERLSVWRRSLDRLEIRKITNAGAENIVARSVWLIVKRPFEGLKKLKNSSGTRVSVLLTPRKVPVSKRIKEIDRLTLELDKLTKLANKEGSRIRRWKNDMETLKDGIRRMEGSFIDQFEAVQRSRQDFWFFLGPTYQRHSSIKHLEELYMHDFILEKVSCGESTYSIGELRRWLIPREKVHIKRMAADASPLAGGGFAVPSGFEPETRLIAERVKRTANAPKWDNKTKRWRVNNHALGPRFHTHEVAVDYSAMATRLRRHVNECELSLYKGYLEDLASIYKKKVATNRRKHGYAERRRDRLSVNHSKYSVNTDGDCRELRQYKQERARYEQKPKPKPAPKKCDHRSIISRINCVTDNMGN